MHHPMTPSSSTHGTLNVLSPPDGLSHHRAAQSGRVIAGPSRQEVPSSMYLLTSSADRQKTRSSVSSPATNNSATSQSSESARNSPLSHRLTSD